LDELSRVELGLKGSVKPLSTVSKRAVDRKELDLFSVPADLYKVIHPPGARFKSDEKQKLLVGLLQVNL